MSIFPFNDYDWIIICCFSSCIACILKACFWNCFVKWQQFYNFKNILSSLIVKETINYVWNYSRGTILIDWLISMCWSLDSEMVEIMNKSNVTELLPDEDRLKVRIIFFFYWNNIERDDSMFYLLNTPPLIFFQK